MFAVLVSRMHHMHASYQNLSITYSGFRSCAVRSIEGDCHSGEFTKTNKILNHSPIEGIGGDNFGNLALLS